jgi:hypothetical protein
MADWHKYFQKAATDTDANYGWVIRDGAGAVVERRYPMFDADGVSKAAAYFDDNRRHCPWDVRASIAKAILSKAAEYGVPVEKLAGSVLREAGAGIPRKSVLMRELNERVRLAKDAEAGLLLGNVNRLIGAATDAEFAESLDKIASVLNRFDEAEGLVQFYGTRLMYPADILAGISLKEAQAFQKNAVRLCRHVFDCEKLAAVLDTDVLTDTLGVAFVDRVKAATSTDPARIHPGRLQHELQKLADEDKAALEDMILTQCDEE